MAYLVLGYQKLEIDKHHTMSFYDTSKTTYLSKLKQTMKEKQNLNLWQIINKKELTSVPLEDPSKRLSLSEAVATSYSTSIFTSSSDPDSVSEVSLAMSGNNRLRSCYPNKVKGPTSFLVLDAVDALGVFLRSHGAFAFKNVIPVPRLLDALIEASLSNLCGHFWNNKWTSGFAYWYLKQAQCMSKQC